MRWARRYPTAEEIGRAMATHLLSYLTEGKAAPALVGARHTGEPTALLNKNRRWPVAVVPLPRERGVNTTAPPHIPDELVFMLRVYDGMVASATAGKDGMREAQERTAYVYGQWRQAIAADHRFRAEVRHWELAGSEGAPLIDRVGRPLQTMGNNLWKHEGTLVVKL